MKNFFVIGNPIEHSFSPKLHNFWFKKNDINAVYNKKKLEENHIENFIQNIRRGEINGSNVTVPFKKKIIPYLDDLSEDAEQTQSVNTIVLKDNSLIGHNTDIEGFSKALISLNLDLKNKKFFILGAGGVVPSIIFALNKIQASEIIITNRTRQKAEDLKVQFSNIKVLDWGSVSDFDVVINATSLGLNDEVINLDFSDIGSNKLFYDIIYNPIETNFLKLGKKLGNKTENGKLMFAYQAAAAFKLWHGIDPIIDEETLKLLGND
tara:strand:- start:480 stop:1274 length:795 start_codon:yes stop_codon:yes gene_type:complete